MIRIPFRRPRLVIGPGVFFGCNFLHPIMIGRTRRYVGIDIEFDLNDTLHHDIVVSGCVIQRVIHALSVV